MKRILFWAFGTLGIVALLFALDVQFGNQVLHEAKAAAGDTLQVDTLTSSANWTAPAGVTSVYVEAWGGGAGGSTNIGGGGGGAYAAKTVAVTPGTSYWVTVGTGGAVNANGVTTTFATTTVVAAPGWRTLYRALGGAVASSTGDVVFKGGDGTLATGNQPGGGAAGDTGEGVADLGGTTNGASAQTSAPAAGQWFGSGGGSGSFSAAAGAPGQVRMTYTSSVDPLYPVVMGRSWGAETTESTSHALTLPSGVQVGDLLLAVVAIDGANNTSTIDGGWTELDQRAQGTAVSQSIFYKIATGSDAATITTANSNPASFIVYRILNGGTPTSTSIGANGTNANPPNLDTGATTTYLWIATASLDSVNTTANRLSASPTSFSSFVTQPARITNGGGATVAVSENFSTVAALNPGTFTSASANYVAGTIAIPYQEVTPPTVEAGPTRRQRVIFID